MLATFSAACERNKGPILEVLQRFIVNSDRRILELGSGTGQHALHFAPHFPRAEWFPTEISGNLVALKANLQETPVPNIKTPVRLVIGKDDFPKLKFDVVFTANTLHIMSWKEGKAFIKLLGQRLREGSRAIIYGPFKYGGEFTSESNGVFDQHLKANNAHSGIRAFEDVNKAMEKCGFELLEDVPMPANNQMLIYSRLKFEAAKK